MSQKHRKDIEELTRHCPIMAACWKTMKVTDGMPYEEMLELTVLSLSDWKRSAMATMADHAMRATPTVFIVNRDDD
jgi:hypothetical protein